MTYLDTILQIKFYLTDIIIIEIISFPLFCLGHNLLPIHSFQPSLNITSPLLRPEETVVFAVP